MRCSTHRRSLFLSSSVSLSADVCVEQCRVDARQINANDVQATPAIGKLRDKYNKVFHSNTRTVSLVARRIEIPKIENTFWAQFWLWDCSQSGSLFSVRFSSQSEQTNRFFYDFPRFTYLSRSSSSSVFGICQRFVSFLFSFVLFWSCHSIREQQGASINNAQISLFSHRVI